MFRILLTIGIGVVLGGATVVAVVDRKPAPTHIPDPAPSMSCPVIDSIDATVPARPAAVERPTDIESVKRAIANVSEFEKKRVLFEIAAEADSATLQRLIFDANRIDDYDDRHTTLLVFFGRLTELDPRSALALAQSDTIVLQDGIVKQVWKLWAIEDLESALQEAVQLPDEFDRKVAAQSMFSAYGYMGNTATRRISAITGIAPDSESRARYLYRLADLSPASAFDQVNVMDSAKMQREAIIHLGHYLVRQEGGRAIGYANRLANSDHRNKYLAVVIRKIAEADPLSALTAISSMDDPRLQYHLFNDLFMEVAQRDIHLAKQLADSLVHTRAKDMAYYRIIHRHAHRDPVESAAWVDLITDQELRQYAQRQVARAKRRISH